MSFTSHHLISPASQRIYRLGAEVYFRLSKRTSCMSERLSRPFWTWQRNSFDFETKTWDFPQNYLFGDLMGYGSHLTSNISWRVRSRSILVMECFHLLYGPSHFMASDHYMWTRIHERAQRHPADGSLSWIWNLYLSCLIDLYSLGGCICTWA